MNGTLRPQIPAAHRVSIIGLLVTLGIVYGDIGTSPLYVMKAILGATPHPTPQYIIGALSCIIWTLTLQATVKYVLIALRADNKNEGGILALYALVRRSRRKWLYVAAIIGADWQVLQAFNPVWAVRLLCTSPEWFLIMGAVFSSAPRVPKRSTPTWATAAATTSTSPGCLSRSCSSSTTWGRAPGP